MSEYGDGEGVIIIAVIPQGGSRVSELNIWQVYGSVVWTALDWKCLAFHHHQDDHHEQDKLALDYSFYADSYYGSVV